MGLVLVVEANIVQMMYLPVMLPTLVTQSLTVVRMILMIVASVVEVELMMMPVIVLGMCWMTAVSAVVITLLVQAVLIQKLQIMIRMPL